MKADTYSIIKRPWRKDDARFEIIKYKEGDKKMWSRISAEDYRKETGKEPK